MRLRNRKGSKETVNNNDYVLSEPEKYKGSWKTFFNNSHPLHIEIGMGKGMFIQTLAASNPNVNYIGIEKFSSILCRALDNINKLESQNLVLVRMEAENICDVFDNGEVSRIYLNFADPWPKKRHAKRRLTSKNFLLKYDKVLIPKGNLQLKTDNRTLFDYSLEQLAECNWNIMYETYDLHNSKYVEGNVATEYEEKFVGTGLPIHKLSACVQDENSPRPS